uniref:Uncharacterized protein n=1 Tax=Oryza punctata TaxID=4537 RepID=A0A0E0KEG6_ORYPU
MVHIHTKVTGAEPAATRLYDSRTQIVPRSVAKKAIDDLLRGRYRPPIHIEDCRGSQQQIPPRALPTGSAARSAELLHADSDARQITSPPSPSNSSPDHHPIFFVPPPTVEDNIVAIAVQFFALDLRPSPRPHRLQIRALCHRHPFMVHIHTKVTGAEPAATRLYDSRTQIVPRSVAKRRTPAPLLPATAEPRRAAPRLPVMPSPTFPFLSAVPRSPTPGARLEPAKPYAVGCRPPTSRSAVGAVQMQPQRRCYRWETAAEGGDGRQANQEVSKRKEDRGQWERRSIRASKQKTTHTGKREESKREEDVHTTRITKAARILRKQSEIWCIVNFLMKDQCQLEQKAETLNVSKSVDPRQNCLGIFELVKDLKLIKQHQATSREKGDSVSPCKITL